MARRVTQAELEAYLEESLPPAEMAAIEQLLRDHPPLIERLSAIHGRRDAGVHSIGEIWRSHRLSCPTREQLGSYLLGALRDEHAAYLRFHLETIGCRLCQANLRDLTQQQQEHEAESRVRRGKYFQSTAGRLRKKS